MKFLRFLSLGLIICILTTVSVLGVEETSFKDVHTDDSYFEAVEYLAEKGIVKGYGNSSFNPEQEITLNHFAIMLIRAFGDSKYEDRPLPVCFSNDWIDINTIQGDPNAPISRGSVYQILLNLEKVSIISAEYKYIVGWTDYARFIDGLGLAISNSEDLSKGITRGEVALLFHYFLTYDVAGEVPAFLNGIKFENTTTQNLGNYYNYFKKVPQSVIDLFRENKWKIVVDEAVFQQYKETTGRVAVGLCSYAEKTIFLKTPSSLIHELGHFIDFISDSDVGIDELYRLEGNQFAMYRGGSFDNSREYFAEFFESYVNAKGDDLRVNSLKNTAPKTFEYMQQLEEDGWKVVYEVTITW